MTSFFSSDWHIGHPRVAEIRGFDDIDDHDNWILEQIVVADADVIYVLGDVIGRDRDWDRAKDLLIEATVATGCTFHLVAGNHDPCHPCRSKSIGWEHEYLSVFDTVAPYRVKRLEGKRLHMSHFPVITGDGHDDRNPDDIRWAEWRLPDLGHPTVHGHLHTSVREHGNQLHVGIDAWGRLVSETEVSAWLRRMTIERSPIAA